MVPLETVGCLPGMEARRLRVGARLPQDLRWAGQAPKSLVGQGLGVRLRPGVALGLTPSPHRAASLATSPSWTPSPLPCGSSCFLPTWLSAVSCFWLPGESTAYWEGRGWRRHEPGPLGLTCPFSLGTVLGLPFGALDSLHPPFSILYLVSESHSSPCGSDCSVILCLGLSPSLLSLFLPPPFSISLCASLCLSLPLLSPSLCISLYLFSLCLCPSHSFFHLSPFSSDHCDFIFFLCFSPFPPHLGPGLHPPAAHLSTG